MNDFVLPGQHLKGFQVNEVCKEMGSKRYSASTTKSIRPVVLLYCT